MLQKTKLPQRAFERALMALALILFCSVTAICQKNVHRSKPSEKNKVFMVADQMPVFNGDLSGYISAHIQYPEKARDAGQEGRVGIKFVVNKTGKIEKVEVIKSSGTPALDREAVRVVKGMPNWKPGKMKGKPVSVYFQLPITFKLE